VCMASPALSSATTTPLYDQVASLNLARNGYTLGTPLTDVQKEKAVANPMEGATPGTYKFTDKGLTVVTDAATHRILILFESFKKVSSQRIQDIVGDLFMQFDEPTVSAHDKIVYWAYDKKGKIPASQYQTAKDQKKNMEVLATVKLNSDIPIMASPATEATPEKSNAYYIISSPILLKQFQMTSTKK